MLSVDGVLRVVAECLQFADGEKRRAAAEATTAAIRSKFNEQVMPPHSAAVLVLPALTHLPLQTKTHASFGSVMQAVALAVKTCAAAPFSPLRRVADAMSVLLQECCRLHPRCVWRVGAYGRLQPAPAVRTKV